MDKRTADRFGSIYRFLGSTELALFLFVGIAAVAVPGTLTERSPLYSTPWFIGLLAALGGNLALCTISRFRTMHRPVLVVHAGVLLVLAGCVVKSSGFVATVNSYESVPVTRFFRWDLAADAELGFGVVVKKIHREFYPIPVRIGVRKDGRKYALHTIRTGESFSLADNFRAEAGPLDIMNRSITLTLLRDNRRIGSYRTATGASDLPAGFPFTFDLVAYQNPRLKNEWVELAILKDGTVVAEGISGVNRPFVWNGYALYNPGTNLDNRGVPYAGIQVVRDPGRPLVFAGLIVLGMGVVICPLRRLKTRQQPRHTQPADSGLKMVTG